MPAPAATLSSPPPLDHVFIVVSGETLAAINACAWLTSEAFGRFATPEGDSPLIGRYKPTSVMGEQTFIELFRDRFGDGEFASVNCGLVFSFREVGDRIAARERLERAGMPFNGELLLRRRPPQEGLRPWYHSTRPVVGGTLALFLSEVTPEYMAQIGAPIGPDGRVERSAYLTASLGRPHPANAVGLDITCVILRLAPRPLARTADVLAQMGYQRQVSEGETRLLGPDTEIRLEALQDGRLEGVREVWMQLRAPQPHRRFDFGGASLELSPDGPNDARAVWRFEPFRVG